MTIKLISKEDHAFLIKMYDNHLNLYLQNKGYQYIDKSKLTSEDLIAIDNIEKLLKNHITGFIKFNNFRLSKDDKLQIRFQYNWDADNEKGGYFTGVGYILIDELLNGFEKDE